MGDWGGSRILVVVDQETRFSPFIRNLQSAIARAGGKAVLAFPDAVPDLLATTTFAAAVLAAERQALVERMAIPVVVYYADDAPRQVLARLRRILGGDDNGPGQAGAGASWRGRALVVLLLLVAAIATGAAIRLALTHGLGWL